MAADKLYLFEESLFGRMHRSGADTTIIPARLAAVLDTFT
jgi:hypothetical protein